MLVAYLAAMMLASSSAADCGCKIADTPQDAAGHGSDGNDAEISSDQAEVERRYSVGDRTFSYTARARFTPLGPEGNPHAEIFHTDYIMSGEDPADRPVTFVFNGGPGAASVFLHMGAVGPVRLRFTDDGRLMPPPVELEPNPDSWLPHTDLVFIDPVGTGFSRFVGEEGKTKGPRLYQSVDGDLRAMGDFIERWLAENKRFRSPVVVAGESYGGFRAAALAQRLPKTHNVPLSGSVMISPKFDLFGGRRDPLHPAPWLTRVPSYAATAASQGMGLAQREVSVIGAMEGILLEAESFAVDDFANFLVAGDMMPADERQRILARFAEITGLDPKYVETQNGRIAQDEFARALLRDEGRLLGIYDATVTGIDPAPDEAEAGYDVDPTLAVLSGPFRAALISFLGEELGFVLPDRSYEPLNREVSGNWRYFVGSERRPQPPAAAEALREGLALNEHLKVWITHGAMDLQTPYFESAYIINNLAIPEAVRSNIRMDTYYGGHMYYMHPQSSAEFAADASDFFASLGSTAAR